MRLSVDHRRALAVLASSPDGCTEATMMAQGCALETLCALVGTGLATAKTVRMVADRKPLEVIRVYIAEAGHAELEG